MKVSRTCKSRLRVEALEDRSTPAVWGNPWPSPENLTLSFAPDGTKLDGVDSSLNSWLGSRMAESTWQLEALRAFQTWASQTNVNVSLTADNGKPFGEAGPIQGSPWFGDIRIGAKPLGAGQLAVATPFDLIDAGAGDITVNTQKSFNQGGTNGAYDLYTVLLQEAGHALGLPNSPSTGSAMYTQYQGPRAGLGAGDAAAVQDLYGTRTPDRLEGPTGNDDFTMAKMVKFVSDADQFKGSDPTEGGDPYVAAGDLTTASDKDFYKFVVPSGSNDFFVQLRTSGVSLLTSRVSVYNDQKVLVKSTAATDPRTGDLQLFVSGARAGKTYYVKVEAAAADMFGVGGYRLAVGKEAYEAAYPPAGSGFVNPDGLTNETPSKAKDMGVKTLSGDDRWEATLKASVESDQDKDFYKIKTGHDIAGGAMVVAVWATEAEKLDPVVRAYTKDGARLPVEVLGNDGSTYTVQLRNVAANTEYFLEIAATDPQGSYKEGNYFAAVDLRATPIELTQFAAGTLTSTAKEQAFKLNVTAGRVFHFNLSAADVAALSAVRMTIYDAAGRAVMTMVARDGETVATDVTLLTGSYTVKVSGGTQSGAALSNLGFTLKGLVRNDPIGVGVDDPTGSPTGSGGGGDTMIYTIDPWLAWLDAYSDPWQGL